MLISNLCTDYLYNMNSLKCTGCSCNSNPVFLWHHVQNGEVQMNDNYLDYDILHPNNKNSYYKSKVIDVIIGNNSTVVNNDLDSINIESHYSTRFMESSYCGNIPIFEPIEWINNSTDSKAVDKMNDEICPYLYIDSNLLNSDDKHIDDSKDNNNNTKVLENKYGFENRKYDDSKSTESDSKDYRSRMRDNK